jgi:hypothetical protein
MDPATLRLQILLDINRRTRNVLRVQIFMNLAFVLLSSITIGLAVSKIDGQFDGSWWLVAVPIFAYIAFAASSWMYVVPMIQGAQSGWPVFLSLFLLYGPLLLALLPLLLYVSLINGGDNLSLGFFPDWVVSWGVLFLLQSLVSACDTDNIGLHRTGMFFYEFFLGVSWVVGGVRMRSTFEGQRNEFQEALVPTCWIWLTCVILGVLFTSLGKLCQRTTVDPSSQKPKNQHSWFGILSTCVRYGCWLGFMYFQSRYLDGDHKLSGLSVCGWLIHIPIMAFVEACIAARALIRLRRIMNG